MLMVGLVDEPPWFDQSKVRFCRQVALLLPLENKKGNGLTGQGDLKGCPAVIQRWAGTPEEPHWD